MVNFSYENEFDLHENELIGETHFHKNGLALRLGLTWRQTRTLKRAIVVDVQARSSLPSRWLPSGRFDILTFYPSAQG